MLKMVDGTGIIGVDMVCPLGGTVSPPQPPNYDKIEMEGVGSLVLPNSLKAPLERLELLGNSVQLTTTGKNLANPSEFVIGTLAGNTGNIINLKQYFTTGYIPVIPGKRYSTSCGNKFSAHTIIAYDKEKTKINSPINMSSEMPEGAAYIRQAYRKIDMTNVTESDMEELKKVCMVNEGSTVLPYEPYTGGKPSPSPEYPQEIKNVGKWNEGTQKYEVDVKVTGKNLLDIKDITSETPQWLEIPCLIKNNIYIKSNNSTVLVENNQARLIVCFKDGTSRAMYDNSMTNGLPFKANSENPITTIKVRGTHIKSGVYSGIQVEYGNEPTPYEPYTEQSMQIALDEPLRGIGEYKDVLTKDGGVRKIKRIVFDENTPFKEYNAPVQVKTTSFISGTAIKDATGETGIEVMSDRFKAKDRGFDRYDEECITLFGKNIFVRFNKDKNINTAEALTEWLKQNPLTVDYVLAEPVTEPLPESVQAQLAALYSENGTTHVFVDSGKVEAGIKLTYRKEK